LRALNYPEQTVEPQPGNSCVPVHNTDYGSLTILLPEPGSKGLEIIAPDGSWTAVPPVPGAFVINIGDLMALWTQRSLGSRPCTASSIRRPKRVA